MAERNGLITSTLLLSEPAMQGLRELCKSWRIRWRSYHTFIGLLPSDPAQYIDRRPADWKAMDIAMLEAGSFPQWSYEYSRLRRQFWLEPGQIDKLATIARAKHISITRQYVTYDTPTQRASSLLEALGSGLLVVRVDRDALIKTFVLR